MIFSTANYVEQLASAFSQVEAEVFKRLAVSLNSARERKANIFLCGNGGSAANANHWANDLIYGAGKTGRGGVRAHSLSANTSVIMCMANDTGYENVFSGPLRVLASPGDILIVLSGSGNSPNILHALEEAKHLDLETWAIVGYDGGKALHLAQNVIHFSINDMQIAEDLQMVVCHEVTKILAKPI